ncbi:serine hydrolase-like protein isoform X1 [Polypterus senegalus]|uniref:serine hydrolase-like protein isoform X1 n=1 Tax=Polypterus senegalus TaxID=55291 RepID=UPI001963740A|nr:serine hydrolase-like protein isoform X1 [Polypterus senegalus]
MANSFRHSFAITTNAGHFAPVMLQFRRFSTSVVCPAMIKVKECQFPVPWGHIAAKSWGSKDGLPVLCLHGWLDNANSFSRLIPLLPQDRHYVAIDFPGHGLSSHRPAGTFYILPKYISDICRVTNVLGWERFSVIGHSMGGSVGCLFSALFPDMVDKVILIDSYGFLPTKASLPDVVQKGIVELLKYEKQKRPNKVYSEQAAIERLMSANPSLSESSAHILLERGTTKVDGGVHFNRDFRINLPGIVRMTIEQVLELQKRITAKLLIILANDGMVKIKEMQLDKSDVDKMLNGYRESVREFHLEMVPGYHHVHLNSPENVAEIISSFLNTPTPAKLSAEGKPNKTSNNFCPPIQTTPSY